MPSRRFSRKFGVEFELNGINQNRAYQILTDAGISVCQEDYWDEEKTNWEIKEDSSVNDGFEIVSPILCGERGIAEAKKVARILGKAGARVDTSCGFHVHVDARDLSVKTILNTAVRYGKFEEEIDQFMPLSRRNSYFAASVKSMIHKNEIPDLISRGRETLSRFDRYYKVNLAAYGRHGTIEFRQHAGTLNPNKVEKWVRFCVEFVEASIINNNLITDRKLNRFYKRLCRGVQTKSQMSTQGFSKSYIKIAAKALKTFGHNLEFYDNHYYPADISDWELVELRKDEDLPVAKGDSLFRGISSSVSRHLHRRVNSTDREQKMLTRNVYRANREVAARERRERNSWEY